MNHKQKLGYMALGAGILAIGIIIGQFITPDIEAKGNGVFDEITCRGLTVANKLGKAAIILKASDLTYYGVELFDKEGNRAIELIADEDGNRIHVSDKADKLAISLSANEDGNRILIGDRAGNLRWAAP